MQNLENVLPTLDSGSFTNALSELNMDKNRYEDRIPCIYVKILFLVARSTSMTISE